MVGFANPAADQLLTGLRKAAAQEEASRAVTDQLIRYSLRRRLMCTTALQAGGRDE